MNFLSNKNINLTSDGNDLNDASIENLLQLFQKGLFDKTIELSGQVIAKNPYLALAYTLLSSSLSALGDKDAAIKCLLEGIKNNPNDSNLYNNLAIIYQGKKDYVNAQSYSIKSIQLNPNSSEAYFTLAVSLSYFDNMEEATKAYKNSFNKNRHNHEALLQTGNSYKDQKKFKHALEVYRKYQKLFPNRVEGFYSEGCLHIRNLKLKYGWKGYECGLKNNNRSPAQGYHEEKKELWDGKKFDGPLLVYGEQGLGDQIIFGTIIPDLLELQNNVIIKVNKKLTNFFKFNFPDITVIEEDQFLPENLYYKYISMGSLCKYFRNETSDFSRSKFKEYKAPNTSIKFKDTLSNKKLNIGVSWFSFAEKTGSKRSFSIKEISEIVSIKDYNFINLQYGDIQNQVNQIQETTNNRLNNIDGINLTDDIDAIANLIVSCDLVITIDNTMAHLSASLGKKTWIILPYSADWRWFENTNKSLWYENAYLLRQGPNKNWSNIISEITEKLKTYNEYKDELL